MDNGSRMTRECHVRFCERLRGQFLWPTHHFGAKAHIGVDDESGLVHSVVVTAANVADVSYVVRPPLGGFHLGDTELRCSL